MPKQRIFKRIARTKPGLQPTALATSGSSDSLKIMSLIKSCCDFARFGAIEHDATSQPRASKAAENLRLQYNDKETTNPSYSSAGPRC